jgi:hypothetical protein
MTIDTWVKLPLVSGALPNNIQAVFSNSNGGFTAAGIRLYINDFNTTNGKVVLEEGNGSAGAGMGSNPGAFPSDGAWHNLAVTIDRTAGTAAAYIDGNQVAGSTSMRTDFPVSTPTDEVGIFGDRANFGLHGLVDDFRIYQGQLTQSEIRALVPEPASITLLALGGLSILARRRTRGD